MAYYENGNLEIDQTKVFLNYLKSGLIWDLMTFIPLLNILFGDNENLKMKITNFLIFSKISSVNQMLDKYKDILSSK